jgi:hypothetical protein
MPETQQNLFNMIVVGDARGPRYGEAGESYQISLWKWSLGRDGMLYKNVGHT